MAQAAMGNHLGEPHQSPMTIGTIMAIVAILAPVGASIHSYTGFTEYNVTIVAMTWLLIVDPFGSYWFVQPLLFFSTLPMTFLRFVFAYMMVRVYQGKSTRKRALVVGVASELQYPVIYLLPILVGVFTPFPVFPIPLFLPIPILLLLGFLIIRIRPPAQLPVSWRADDQSGWWQEDKND